MKKHLRNSLAAAAMALVAPCASAIIPLDYYSPLQGLCGAELKDAIFSVISNPEVDCLSYGSSTNYSWWGLYILDRVEEDNSVIDRYSYDEFYFLERGSSIEGMDIEHAMPKSWWKPEDKNTDWVLRNTNGAKDLHQLMPAETKINISKSNNPIGIVVTPTKDNGCTKVGQNAEGVKVWEPGDEWKGDFARVYMYMATAYQDYEWTAPEAAENLENGPYPTLNAKTQQILLDWARNDQVAEIEVVRCNKVKSLQNNRNPYIDFPNLMEYVWGDSIDRPLDLYTTVKSDAFTGVVREGEPVEVFNNTFLENNGNCKIENIDAPVGVSEVWTHNTKYGWIGHGGKGGSSSNHESFANHARLVIPGIDLSRYYNASLKFTYRINNFGAELSTFGLAVRDAEGNDFDITDRLRWSNTGSWTWFQSGEISLNEFTGQKVSLVFDYQSTDESASRIDMQNFVVTASMPRPEDGVQAVIADNLNSYPVEYYSLDGRRIDPQTTESRIVIRRQGPAATKIHLR